MKAPGKSTKLSTYFVDGIIGGRRDGGFGASGDSATRTRDMIEKTIPQKPPVARTGAGRGVEAIERVARTLPGTPGVYRMLDAKDTVLYVGKARNLRKRVASYIRLDRLTDRIARMVRMTARMEIVTTHTEAEALLLEANLIKRLKPRYNILLRDDKSFPYIHITGDHVFPRIVKHRGARSRSGHYFGPFASAWAVNKTINHLQRAFLLRSCTDAVLANRTRPCLLHQIKRCSAPCVDRIDGAGYGELVDSCRDFLGGKSRRIVEDLKARMLSASESLDFEDAARHRDRIRAMAHIQSHQGINLDGVDKADVIAVHQAGGHSCVQVFFFRSGSNYGNRAYFPAHAREDGPSEVLAAFLTQFYTNKPAPRLILLSEEPAEARILSEALGIANGRKVALAVPRRGQKRKLIDHVLSNAREALDRRLAESASQRKLLEGLADTLGLDGVPARIEVYDNSHIQGTSAVGGMIVAGPDGFEKSQYRKFNIKGGGKNDPAPGDDYAMMREVLTRRFSRALKEDPDRETGTWPDVCLIDGGPGQLSVALETFAELGIEDVGLAGVAKGPERNAGREVIYLPDRAPLRLEARDPVLYFIQRLRDEAHRWAIGSHRQRRAGTIARTGLNDIAGVGGLRKKKLLHHFGSARGVSQAGLADLEAVEGISKALAKRIYDHFHSDD